MSETKVSGIIPCYNKEDYICEAICSMVEQSFPLDEICVVDDASEDDSVIRAHEFLLSRKYQPEEGVDENRYSKKGSPDVEIIKLRKNMGVSHARNVGIRNTKGIVLAFLDADDIYYKDKVKKSMEIFVEFPHVVMVYSDAVDYFQLEDRKEINRFESYDYETMCHHNIPNSNSLIQRQGFDYVGLFDERLSFAEDYDMWLRLAEVGSIYHIPEPLWEYRHHDKNENRFGDKARQSQCLNIVRKKLQERRNNAS